MTVHHLTCSQCGAAFEAVRNDARFCSAACRQDSHRGVPPRQQPRAQASPPLEQEPQPAAPRPKEPPLHPDRRAWLSIEGRRCWFQINWEPDFFDDPTFGAHEELGQWWIGINSVQRLRRELGHCRAEVFELDHGGPLPQRFLLELMSSQHPLERAVHALLMATPPERWRKMIRNLSVAAHPDGATGYRPRAADDLLEICNGLLNNPDLA